MSADAVFKTFVDEDAKEEIRDAAPCDAEEPPCEHRATWAIVMRERCSHGAPLKAPFIYLYCDEHKAVFLSMYGPGSGYFCVSCMCPLTDLSHHVMRITRL